ncbi:MAG: MFS transporter [Acidobacteriota bacterium]|nr:MFS transporter [Pyrinomonadaceae bacterium]MDW8303681.1 MFS transporter [Acidobacteriota bacterium]
MELLKTNKNFRNLFWGQLISELGNWFNYIAGLGLVRAISGASPEAAGTLLLCRTLPWALLMPFAGTVADLFSRRQIMLVTDIARAFIALIFLLIDSPEELWIAYLGSILLSSTAAFFDGAKSASVPNLAGKEGLLSAVALIFSSRFLFMAVGAALGGLVSSLFGYKAAFLINSVSFLISAFSVWLIPEDAMQQKELNFSQKESFFYELKEGVRYTIHNSFAFTILLMNIIWAVGGGATFIIFEGLAVQVFKNLNPDFTISFLMTSNGIGLTLGMLIAHRVGSIVQARGQEISFIGWTLILHGILFAAASLVSSLFLAAALILLSRTIIGVEYAVQETIFQKSLPDYIRGRISTLDRGAEITVFSLSSYVAGISLTFMPVQTVALLAGLIASSSGVFWFLRMKNQQAFRMEKA